MSAWDVAPVTLLSNIIIMSPRCLAQSNVGVLVVVAVEVVVVVVADAVAVAVGVVFQP